MSIVLVTGSSDGLGAQIAADLVQAGHDVIFHARTTSRADELKASMEPLTKIVSGDLSSFEQTRSLAAQVAEFRPEIIVHNAGFQSRAAHRVVTGDGLEETFQINAVAPYLLTALLPPMRRLVFISSDSIIRARVDLRNLQHEQDWSIDTSYADSKLAMTVIAMGWARRYPQTLTTAVHPGWVRTRMAGDIAPLSVEEGADTPVWLATSEESAALVQGGLYTKRGLVNYNPQTSDVELQDGLLDYCASVTGTEMPCRSDDYQAAESSL